MIVLSSGEEIIHESRKRDCKEKRKERINETFFVEDPHRRKITLTNNSVRREASEKLDEFTNEDDALSSSSDVFLLDYTPECIDISDASDYVEREQQINQTYHITSMPDKKAHLPTSPHIPVIEEKQVPVQVTKDNLQKRIGQELLEILSSPKAIQTQNKMLSNRLSLIQMLINGDDYIPHNNSSSSSHNRSNNDTRDIEMKQSKPERHTPFNTENKASVFRDVNNNGYQKDYDQNNLSIQQGTPERAYRIIKTLPQSCSVPTTPPQRCSTPKKCKTPIQEEKLLDISCLSNIPKVYNDQQDFGHLTRKSSLNSAKSRDPTRHYSRPIKRQSIWENLMTGEFPHHHSSSKTDKNKRITSQSGNHFENSNIRNKYSCVRSTDDRVPQTISKLTHQNPNDTIDMFLENQANTPETLSSDSYDETSRTEQTNIKPKTPSYSHHRKIQNLEETRTYNKYDSGPSKLTQEVPFRQTPMQKNNPTRIILYDNRSEDAEISRVSTTSNCLGFSPTVIHTDRQMILRTRTPPQINNYSGITGKLGDREGRDTIRRCIRPSIKHKKESYKPSSKECLDDLATSKAQTLSQKNRPSRMTRVLVNRIIEDTGSHCGPLKTPESSGYGSLNAKDQISAKTPYQSFTQRLSKAIKNHPESSLNRSIGSVCPSMSSYLPHSSFLKTESPLPHHSSFDTTSRMNNSEPRLVTSKRKRSQTLELNSADEDTPLNTTFNSIAYVSSPKQKQRLRRNEDKTKISRTCRGTKCRDTNCLHCK